MSIAKKKIIFYFILFFSTILFFCFNYYATNQQFILPGTEEQIIGTNVDYLYAKDIIKYKKCIFTLENESEPNFSRSWGYPFLNVLGIKSGNHRLFLSILQGILLIHGIWIFYKIFDIREKLYHIFLFIPFFGVLSVRWRHGIVCYLGLLFCYFILKALDEKNWRIILYSGIILGIIANFASEYVLLPIFFLLFIRFLKLNLKIPFNVFFKAAFIICFIQVLFILPWTVRSIRYDGIPRLTNTLSGAALYLSLGQLPNNPWGLIGDDPDYWEFAQTHNEYGELVEKQKIDLQKISSLKRNIIYSIMERYRYDRGEPIYRAHFSPEGPKGDKLLKKEAIKLIKQHPGAFAKKVIYNFWKIFRNGVYTNEFWNFNITEEKLKKMIEDFWTLDKKGKIFYLCKAFISKDNRRIVIGYGINAVFRIIFPLLLIFFFVSTFVAPFKYKSKIKRIFFILLPIIIYKILLVSFLQYAPRCLNFIYMPLLGYFLIFFQINKNYNE